MSGSIFAKVFRILADELSQHSLLQGNEFYTLKGDIVANNRKQSGERKSRTFKSIIIEPFKQMKFGIYVLTLSLSFVVANAALFIYAFNQQYQQVMSLFSVVDPSVQWDFLTNDVFVTNAYLVAGLLVTYMVALFAVIFRLTHRYYGPLVSVERLVENLTQGRYNSRIQVRGSDELQRLVAKLNVLAENLEKKHGELVDEKGQKVERRNRRPDQFTTSEPISNFENMDNAS
ncbi:HAMP domain-containing protein [Dolichospermum sp. ST_sed1]|nr:HAMP domain-containing protein [Dolichospermum sp. ST_sed1]